MKTVQQTKLFQFSHVYLPGKQEAYPWKSPNVPLFEGPSSCSGLISFPLASLNFVSIVWESLSRFILWIQILDFLLKAGSQLLQVALGTPEIQQGGQAG